MMQNPLIISNYQLLKEIGILDYISELGVDNRNLENLLSEAYEIFRKESVEELVNFVINCLSDKFIPSNLIIILNHGIMFNRIKTLVYKNLKLTETELVIETLEPYEKFFSEYTGTTSFAIFEDVIDNADLVAPFEVFNPEIMVPVLGRSGLYGLILFGPKVLGQEYALNEIAYIDQLTKFTSIGIQNNIHYEHSVRDSKTGLYNHNFFIRRVEEEIARVKRSGATFSVIILDIDHFKKFNDTYGHMAGDEIILGLAKKIKYVMREQDILSRFGGEEFTVLLPFSDREEALIAAERLRKSVESMIFDYEGVSMRITISLGVASYNGRERYSANIMSRADSALYRSKEEGRNRSSFFIDDDK